MVLLFPMFTRRNFLSNGGAMRNHYQDPIGIEFQAIEDYIVGHMRSKNLSFSIRTGLPIDKLEHILADLAD